MTSFLPAGHRAALTGVVRRLRRLLWRRRLVLAAASCGLAAALGLHVLRPPPPPTADVVLTAHPVAPGEELTADDVTVRAVARDLVPPGAVSSVSDAVGRVPVVRLPGGLPLHAALAVEPGIGATAPPGTVVVPVRLADPAVNGLLRPGDRVDLVPVDDGLGMDLGSGAAADGGAVPYLARRALVLPLPAAPRGASGGLLGGTTTEAPAVTLVAVSPDEAPGLSAVSGRGTVAAVLVP